METIFFWYLVFCIQFFNHLHNFSKLDFCYPKCYPRTYTPPTKAQLKNQLFSRF